VSDRQAVPWMVRQPHFLGCLPAAWRHPGRSVSVRAAPIKQSRSESLTCQVGPEASTWFVAVVVASQKKVRQTISESCRNISAVAHVYAVLRSVWPRGLNREYEYPTMEPNVDTQVQSDHGQLPQGRLRHDMSLAVN
jgi:hypothetical protein